MKAVWMKGASAVLMLALLLGFCAFALAAETAPLAVSVMGEESTTDAGRLYVREEKHELLTVTVSEGWLWQGRIDGVLLNLRLFTPQGVSVTFKETLSLAGTGDNHLRLALRASKWEDDLILQLDQRAIDVMRRVGVTRLVVADPDGNIRADYLIDDLQGVRDLFSLGAEEQLCLSGEDNPVTVVSEDGIRRRLTK